MDNRLVARKKTAIAMKETLKETNRLKSNCSATSSINTLFLGHCFLPCGHVASWPLCDMRNETEYAICEITNPSPTVANMR